MLITFVRFVRVCVVVIPIIDSDFFVGVACRYRHRV